MLLRRLQKEYHGPGSFCLSLPPQPVEAEANETLGSGYHSGDRGRKRLGGPNRDGPHGAYSHRRMSLKEDVRVGSEPGSFLGVGRKKKKQESVRWRSEERRVGKEC